MDRSRELVLIAKTFTADSIGQLVPAETRRTVFCDVRSVTRSEWATAGQLGLKAEYVATMFAPDYEGEEACELEGVLYGIYRTFLGLNERIELYLERKVGVTNG